MTDHNSPEAVAARASQTDPIIMYLIVRESLNMSIGKTAAQCGHAVQMLQIKYEDLKSKLLCGWETTQDKVYLTIYKEWLETSFRKVVLTADDKKWAKIKSQFTEDMMVLVIDAGLTEIEPGSETFIGLMPMRKSEAPKIIKRLQVLK